MAFFGSEPVEAEDLGRLERRRGLWRGELVVAGVPVALAIAGPRQGPDPEAVRIARTVQAELATWAPQIGRELLEHRSNDEDAVGADDPAGAWAEVTLEYVSGTPLDRVLTVELGPRAPWDEEHTLGARIRDGALVELNGSVLAP